MDSSLIAPLSVTRSLRTVGTTWATPATDVLVSFYVMSLVLFAQIHSTYLIASVVGFALVLVFLVELFGKRNSICFPGALIFFTLFICFCTFQMVWAPGSVRQLLTLIQLLIAAIVIVNSAVYGKGLVAVEAAFYVAVPSTFIYNFLHSSTTTRVGSTLLNPNGYSFVLLIGLLFALRRMLLLPGKGRKARGGILVSAVLYSCLCLYGIVYLASSRKGMLISVICMIAFAVFSVWRQPVRRRLLLSILAVLPFVAVGYILYRSPQFSRIIAIQGLLTDQNNYDHSLAVRSSLLSDAVRLWLQRPFAGWGLDQFKIVSGWGYYAHDNYVELLANNGILGLLSYVGIYVAALVSLASSLWRTVDRRLKVDLVWALILLVALVTWDVGAVSYYDKINWVVISVVAAVAASARIRARGTQGVGAQNG